MRMPHGRSDSYETECEGGDAANAAFLQPHTPQAEAARQTPLAHGHAV